MTDATTSAKAHPLDEDLRFQHRQWRVERIGWALMVLLVIAALTGLFGGGGPLTRGEAIGDAGKSAVQYDRFARFAKPTTLEVNGHSDGAGRLRLQLNEGYFASMTLRSIVPPPLTVAITEGTYEFVFAAPRLSPATIHLEVEPTSIGRTVGRIAINDGSPLSFNHFVYP